VYGAFLTQVSYGRLVDENLYPKDFFRIAGNHMLHARFPLTAASVVELGGLLALYGIGVAGLTLLSRTLGGPRRRLWLAVAAAGGAAVTAGSLADPEAVRHALHFAWGWIPAGAIVGVVVLLRRRSQVGLAETAALAVLAGTTYHAFFVEAWHAQMGVYATPLAASFLVRLHMTELRSAARVGTVWVAALALAICGLTLKDARAESLTVHGPGGSLRESPEQARVYQRVVDIVVARTRPNEAVLFAPQLAALYAIAQRENPLPQVSLLPGTLAGPAQEREAIRRLDRAQVRLIVIDERLATGYGHTRFGESYDRVLAAWIRSHFTHIARVRDAATSPTLDVWSRRDS
jgi:hypothetical protein